MPEIVSGLLQAAGAILVLAGILIQLWDNQNPGAFAVIVVGGLALLVSML